MTVRLLNPPITEYEVLVWCPRCVYGIKVWSQAAHETRHDCAACGRRMQVFHRDCPLPSPVRREIPVAHPQEPPK